MNAHPSKLSPGDARRVPSAGATVLTLAGVTLTRLARGKAVWIGIVIAALPVVFATVVKTVGVNAGFRPMLAIATLVLVVLPAMFVGASIGEEIEARTSTYLWSRPIARWAVVVGKLLASTPIVIALAVGGWVTAVFVWRGAAPSLASCLALAAGGLAGSLIAAGVATVLPRHGMALTIGYMLVDSFMGAMPVSLRELSVIHQTHVLTYLFKDDAGITQPLIMMAIVCGIWTAVGFLRIQRLET